MDAARLGAGECVVPGAHVLEVHAGLVSEGVVTARHGTERIDVPADGRLVVDVEAGLDAGTLATTSTLQHGESVISSGRCPIFASTQPSELARVVVSLLPERSHRVRLLRVRAAIDGVLVVDRDGSGSESGEPEPSLASGWVAPGEHLLALEHTYLHAYGGYTPTRPRTACGTRSPSSSRPQARRCECVRVSTGG
jgi:hypothetical protein